MTSLRKRLSSVFLYERADRQKDKSPLEYSPRNSSSVSEDAFGLESGNFKKPLKKSSTDISDTLPHFFNSLSEGFRWSASLLHRKGDNDESSTPDQYIIGTPNQNSKKSKRWSATWSRSSGKSRNSAKWRNSVRESQGRETPQTPVRSVDTRQTVQSSQPTPALAVDIPNPTFADEFENARKKCILLADRTAPQPDEQNPCTVNTKVTFDELSLTLGRKFEQEQINSKDPFHSPYANSVIHQFKSVEDGPRDGKQDHGDRESLPSYQAFARSYPRKVFSPS